MSVRDSVGVQHRLVVEPAHECAGDGSQLFKATISAAQRLRARFRRTLVKLTRDL